MFRNRLDKKHLDYLTLFCDKNNDVFYMNH